MHAAVLRSARTFNKSCLALAVAWFAMELWLIDGWRRAGELWVHVGLQFYSFVIINPNKDSI